MAVRIARDAATGVVGVVGPLELLRAWRVDTYGAAVRTSSGAPIGASGPMYSNGRPDYRVRAGAVAFPTRYPSRGASAYVLDQGGPARWITGAPPDSAIVALQGYPELVRDGAVQVSDARDTERVARVGFGLTGDGECVLASLTAGPILTLARGMLALGCDDAAYLDGGRAAAWWAPGERSLVPSVPVPVVVGWSAEGNPQNARTAPRSAGARPAGNGWGTAALVLLAIWVLSSNDRDDE